MAVNTLGYQPVFDFGAPRIIGGKAREVISGGELVFASGAGNAVGSGTASFATSDLLFATDASGALFNGVAMHNAASGANVSIAVDGVFLVTAGGNIVAGNPLFCDGNNSVIQAGSVAANLAGMRVIGRALTEGTSGTTNCVLAHLRGA